MSDNHIKGLKVFPFADENEIYLPNASMLTKNVAWDKTAKPITLLSSGVLIGTIRSIHWWPGSFILCNFGIVRRYFLIISIRCNYPNPTEWNHEQYKFL
jgi:hypothetical protein